ncbi:MAG: amidohydrolase [Promethearchaeota archaeon]|nr:MAG: amidohydrolase [Candidatus Lokiarchaeota archaeon]
MYGFKMNNLTINLFYNCIILTVDKNDSKAKAMAIYEDKILTIGEESVVRNEIENFKRESNENINLIEKNLDGACIVPGFIDAHMHPVMAIYFKTQINLLFVKSYSELEAVLKREDRTREEDEWLFGYNLMEQRFEDPGEHYFPDRYKLDEFCPNRPVIILRYDGHICSVNSIALKKIGISRDTLKEFTPNSGEIQLDAKGNPTGVFTEGATSYAIENATIPSRERFLEAAKKFTYELATFGITTCGVIVQIGETGIAGKMGSVELPFIKYIINQGVIEQDFVFYLATGKPKKINQVKRSFSKLFGEKKRYTIGGLKVWADGSFGASTAYLFKPFTDSPEGKTGFMILEKDKLYELFNETYQLGFPIACHAIGDQANRIVVDVFRDVINENKKLKSLRCRIEHASLVNKKILADAADLGLIFVCQPSFINSEYTWLEKRLGSERIKYVYPFRSIIDSGIILAGASDAPVESANVLEALHACITRNGFVPEQSISISEALRIFTYNAAYALGQETIKGSLEKGKLADFVILNHNIMTHPIDKLTELKIIATFHRGNKIFPLD